MVGNFDERRSMGGKVITGFLFSTARCSGSAGNDGYEIWGPQNKQQSKLLDEASKQSFESGHGDSPLVFFPRGAGRGRWCLVSRCGEKGGGLKTVFLTPLRTDTIKHAIFLRVPFSLAWQETMQSLQKDGAKVGIFKAGRRVFVSGDF